MIKVNLSVISVVKVTKLHMCNGTAVSAHTKKLVALTHKSTNLPWN